MSFFGGGDLSVTGTATSRHARPHSGKGRRTFSQRGSTKSHIFNIAETPRDIKQQTPGTKSPSYHGDSSPATSSLHTTPDAPRQGNGPVLTEQRKQNTRLEEQPSQLNVHPPSRARNTRKAPAGVPQLNLGSLSDENDKLLQPAEHEAPHYHTPDSRTSNVSWGTPLNSTTEIGNQVKGHPVLSENRKKPVGMPSLELDQSGEGANMKALKKRNEELLRQAAVTFQEPVKGESTEKNNGTNWSESLRHKKADSKVVPEQQWSVKPVTQREQIKQRAKQEQEKLFTEKKKEIFEEQLLVDQLSRAAISDPQASLSPALPLDAGPKERKHMEFYNTRPRQSGSNTENLLAKRVRFAARVLTKNGHDAHRELNGFFFSADNTLTVYEFRQFGTRSSALPFIQRGTYSHVTGRKKGKQYTLQDIIIGSSLSFTTRNQNSLPESIKSKPVVSFRLTEVDEEARQRLMFEDCRSPAERRLKAERLHEFETEEERKQLQLLAQVQATIKQQLRKRAVKTLMGLGKHFRRADTSKDGMLDQEELRRALQQYRLQLPGELFERLWSVLDVNGDGVLDYGEFSRGFFGEMNERRKTCVRKVFHKLDPSKQGIIKLIDMKKFYSVHKHPMVILGQVLADDLERDFLSSFQHCENRGEVTYAEFEDYYEGISIDIDDDDEFVAMVTSCWGVTL